MTGRRPQHATMLRPVHDTERERGETLLELLIAIAILGIAVVAIVAGIATALTASDVNRKQARVETLLRNYAEAVTNPAVGYVECATTGSYPSAPTGFTLPSGYSISITSMAYWNADNPATFTSTCPANPDNGVQRVTVRVNSSDVRGDKTLTFVKRRP